MGKYFFNLNSLLLLFSIILVSSLSKAQEYPTDRLFMKHFKKTKCLRDIDNRINKLKKKREMTLEHEVLLNNSIWYKLRTKLPLSSGEMERLLFLRKNGFAKNRLSSKKLWAKKVNEFKALRSKCK